MMNKSVSILHRTPMIYKNVKPFENLHIDLWEAPVPSVQGCKYGMLIVDHYSRFTFGIHIVSKSDAVSSLIKFIEFHHKKFKRKIKSIRADQPRSKRLKFDKTVLYKVLLVIVVIVVIHFLPGRNCILVTMEMIMRKKLRFC